MAAGSESSDRDPGIHKRESLTLKVLPPIIDPLFNGAGKLKSATEAGLVLAAKKLATDGGGARIAKHRGCVADGAARAWWGNGPLKNGGLGIAGGNAKLDKMGTVVAITFVVTVVAAPIAVDLMQLRRTKAGPATAGCERCQGKPAENADADFPAADASCRHCSDGQSEK